MFHCLRFKPSQLASPDRTLCPNTNVYNLLLPNDPNVLWTQPLLSQSKLRIRLIHSQNQNRKWLEWKLEWPYLSMYLVLDHNRNQNKIWILDESNDRFWGIRTFLFPYGIEIKIRLHPNSSNMKVTFPTPIPIDMNRIACKYNHIPICFI